MGHQTESRPLEHQRNSLSEQIEKLIRMSGKDSDADARLSRLEGRLDTLIDGFTQLAQELRIHLMHPTKTSRDTAPAIVTKTAFKVTKKPERRTNVVKVVSTSADQEQNGPIKTTVVSTKGKVVKKKLSSRQLITSSKDTFNNLTSNEDNNKQNKSLKTFKIQADKKNLSPKPTETPDIPK